MAVNLTNPGNFIQYASAPIEGTAYDETLSRVQWSRNGGSIDYTFTSIDWSVISGALPAGMSLGGAFASSSYFYIQLQGTPTESGSFTIGLQCSVDWAEASVGYNGTGNTTSNASMTFTVDAPASLPNVDNGDGTGTDENGDDLSLSVNSVGFYNNISYSTLTKDVAWAQSMNTQNSITLSAIHGPSGSNSGKVIRTYTVDSITGLPPGVTYSIAPGGGVTTSSSTFVFQFAGTPTSAGTYTVDIDATYTEVMKPRQG